jgi:hypothetical protein
MQTIELVYHVKGLNRSNVLTRRPYMGEDYNPGKEALAGIRAVFGFEKNLFTANDTNSRTQVEVYDSGIVSGTIISQYTQQKNLKNFTYITTSKNRDIINMIVGAITCKLKDEKISDLGTVSINILKEQESTRLKDGTLFNRDWS